MSNLIFNFISFNELSPTMKLVFIVAFAILAIMFFNLSIDLRNEMRSKDRTLFTILWATSLGVTLFCAVMTLNLIFFGYLMQ